MRYVIASVLAAMLFTAGVAEAQASQASRKAVSEQSLPHTSWWRSFWSTRTTRTPTPPKPPPHYGAPEPVALVALAAGAGAIAVARWRKGGRR